MRILKYNEHIQSDQDDDGFDYDPNEVLDLVGLPSGQYFTITRKEYTYKLKEIITWSENLHMYAYRDKDYTKIKYALITDRLLGGLEEDNSISNIHALLKRWGVRDYKIINGDKVLVNDSVAIRYDSFTEIPIKFEKVSGDFTIELSHINTLVNCPKIVGGDFKVFRNKLNNLIGGPVEVGGNYNCSYNNLTSLIGAPEKTKNFDCSGNNLSTLRYSPKIVDGNFNCSFNFLNSLKEGPLSVNGIFNCEDNKLHNLKGLPLNVVKIISQNNPLI